MEQCWNADPSERPDVDKEINHANTSSKLFTSKIHKFENLSEPKNATEEEQEAFHSKLYDFNIPENIDDFDQSSKQNSKRISNIIKAGNTRLTNVFKKLRVNSSKSVDVQNNYYKDATHQPQTGNIDDDDEYNNPNLHSEE
ncbi:unnamed protein product [Rhizophagus irregularis]|nr:unnamed protein product [Rhizophagus irregularis]